jgi:microcystin-dependent protein
MLIDFPSAPIVGQTFAAPNGVTYKWNGQQWIVVGMAAPLDSPQFTGDPHAPTPPFGDNDTSIPTTFWVHREYAPLDSASLTGAPQASPSPTDSSLDARLATVGYVKARTNQFLPLTGGSITGSVDISDALTVKHFDVPNIAGNYAHVPIVDYTDNSAAAASTAWVRSLFATRGQGDAIYRYEGNVVVPTTNPGVGNFMGQPDTTPPVPNSTQYTFSISTIDADGVGRYLLLFEPGDSFIITNEFTPVTDYSRFDIIDYPVPHPNPADPAHAQWVIIRAVYIGSSTSSGGTGWPPPVGTRVKLTGYLNTATGDGPILGVAVTDGLTGGGTQGDIVIGIDETYTATHTWVNANFMPLGGGTFTGPVYGTSFAAPVFTAQATVNPGFAWFNSDNAVNLKRWDMRAWDDGNMYLRRLDDSGTDLGHWAFNSDLSFVSPGAIFSPNHVAYASVNPSVGWQATGNGLDLKLWDMQVRTDGNVYLRAVNDAFTVEQALFIFHRNGSVTFPGELIVNAPALGVAAGSKQELLYLETATANVDRVTVRYDRPTAGGDWSTAMPKLLRTVDASEHGYLFWDSGGVGLGFTGVGTGKQLEVGSNGLLYLNGNATVDAPGNINTVAQVAGSNFALQSGGGMANQGGANGYTFFTNGSNQIALYLGGSAVGNLSIHRNTLHLFQNLSGSSDYMRIGLNSGHVEMSVGASPMTAGNVFGEQWSYFTSNIGLNNPRTDWSSGMAVGWNYSNGAGEVNLVERYGAGFHFQHWPGGTGPMVDAGITAGTGYFSSNLQVIGTFAVTGTAQFYGQVNLSSNLGVTGFIASYGYGTGSPSTGGLVRAQTLSDTAYGPAIMSLWRSGQTTNPGPPADSALGQLRFEGIDLNNAYAYWGGWNADMVGPNLAGGGKSDLTAFVNYGGASVEMLRLSGAQQMLLTSYPIHIARNTASNTADLLQEWKWSPDPTNWGLHLNQRHTGTSLVYDFLSNNGTGTYVKAITFAPAGVTGFEGGKVYMGNATGSQSAKLQVWDSGGVLVAAVADDSHNGLGVGLPDTNIGTATQASGRLYMTGANAAHAACLELNSGSVVGSVITMRDPGGVTSVNITSNGDSLINGGIYPRADLTSNIGTTSVRYANGYFGGVTIYGGGQWQPGAIYADATWGMLFRAQAPNPTAAQFAWFNNGGVELFRYTTADTLLLRASPPSTSNDNTVATTSWVKSVAPSVATPTYDESSTLIADTGTFPGANANNVMTITMGQQVFSRSFTAVDASHPIEVDIILNLGAGGSAMTLAGALFIDGATNAVAQEVAVFNTAWYGPPTRIRWRGTLAAGAHTFAVRFAGNAANGYLNSTAGNPVGGGAMKSSMSITEVGVGIVGPQGPPGPTGGPVAAPTYDTVSTVVTDTTLFAGAAGDATMQITNGTQLFSRSFTAVDASHPIQVDAEIQVGGSNSWNAVGLFIDGVAAAVAQTSIFIPVNGALSPGRIYWQGVLAAGAHTFTLRFGGTTTSYALSNGSNRFGGGAQREVMTIQEIGVGPTGPQGPPGTPGGVLFPGQITPYAGSTAPSGYVMCDGASYSTSGAMSALFAVIAYTYGGSGSNFNVPDLRGRVIAMVDVGGLRLSGAAALNAAVGVQGATTGTVPGAGIYGIVGGGPAVGDHSHSNSTVQPTLVLNYIIKT